MGAGLLAMGSTRLSRPTAAPASRASPLPQRCGLQFQSFRTTFRFHSRESSEKIPLACACSNRGIVSAHRCKSAVGFSRLVDEQGARRHLSEAFFLAPLYGGRAQGALGRAGFRAHRSTNLRTAATRSFWCCRSCTWWSWPRVMSTSRWIRWQRTEAARA